MWGPTGTDELTWEKLLDPWGGGEIELRHSFITLGIPLRIGSEDLMEAQAEVDAIRAWFAPAQKAGVDRDYVT
ncbi:MAG: hypothetical protein GY799_19980 [Desulfobulbaceae bacterium]|nr:hypothetical protein [Desulfobulbaceae bacterium]